METKKLSQLALNVIDQYLNFKVGSAVCPIPYLNNKTAKNKMALRAYKGKGSPQDIRDEFEIIAVKSHIDQNNLTNESLKKILTDNGLGIDCSGFSYHILDAECQNKKNKKLKNFLSFTNCRGLIRKIVCKMRPVENCDVVTFASDANSRIINLKDILPGDIITMTAGSDSELEERNHILVVSEISYADNKLVIGYIHSIAYPEDGKYGTGVRQGSIEIEDANRPIIEAKWLENNSKESSINRLLERAKKSKTEIRRLKFF